MKELQTSGISLAQAELVSLAQFCSSSSRLSDALEFIRTAKLSGAEISDSLYNAVISQCVNAGKTDIALQLLEEMSKLHRKLDQDVVKNLVQRCSDAGLGKQTLQLVAFAHENSVDLGEAALASAARSLNRAGDVDNACILAKSMKQFGFNATFSFEPPPQLEIPSN